MDTLGFAVDGSIQGDDNRETKVASTTSIQMQIRRKQLAELSIPDEIPSYATAVPSSSSRPLKAHALLQHVDFFLLPLLRTDLPIVHEALDKYLNSFKPSQFPADNVDNKMVINKLEDRFVTTDELLGLFPEHYQEVVQHLCRHLGRNVNLVGFHISVLDVMTVLAVFSKGHMEDRATLLFQMYNFTGNGLLSELELVRFITRVSKLFHLLKLAPSLEITAEDARYYVTLARLKGHEKCSTVRDNQEDSLNGGYNINAPPSTLPNFKYKDFLHFLKTNQISLTIFKVIDTLTRLYTTMQSLGDRSDVLFKELLQKSAPMSRHLHVPRINEEWLQCQKRCCGKIILVHKGTSSCSFSIPSKHIRHLEDVYVSCAEIKTLQHIQANASTYTEIPLYQICRLQKGTKDFTVPYYRIDVPNLRQNSKYHICVYQKGLHFEKCAVFTNSSDGKERKRPTFVRNETDGMILTENDTYEDLEHECVILPSLVSGMDMSATRLLFDESTPLSSTKCLYFTGAICCADEVLDQAVRHADYMLTPTKIELLHALYGASRTQLFSSWQYAMECVYSNVIPNIAAPPGKVHRYERKSVIYHPSIGPFSCASKLEYYGTKTPLQPIFQEIESKLCNVNASFIECLKPREFVQRIEQTLIVTVADSNGAYHKWGVHARDFVEIVDAEINKTSSGTLITDVIILLKDISALMEPKSSWVVTDEKTDITSDITTDANGIKLTGAHEIKYGAYSASDPSSRSATKSSVQSQSVFHDSSFFRTCEYLFQFLGNNLYERNVVMVSSGWHKGYNFFLTRGGSTIAHHNLLIPSPHHVFDNSMDHVDIMRRMKHSLPPSCEANLSFSPEESIDERIFVKINRKKKDSTQTQRTANISEPVYKFISCRSLAEHKIIAPVVVQATKLSITSGPKIRHLSDQEVLFYAEFKGTGVIKCTLYDIPNLANYTDAVSLVLSERDQLKTIRTIERRVIGFKTIIFKFEDLQPLSAYVMCIEIDGSEGKTMSSFFHFRTLMRPSSRICSVALLSLSTRDHCFPSYRLSKMLELLDKSTTSMPMYLIHTRATSVPSCKLTGAGECFYDHLQSYGDVQELNKRGQVTYLKPSRKNSNLQQDREDDDKDGVNVTRHGIFCRISLKCGGLSSIMAATDEVTKIAKHPSAEYSSIVSILIFTQQPLLPYLSRNPLEEPRQAGSAPIANIEGCNYNIDENEVLHPWEHDGPFANPDNEGAIVQLIGALLNWKKGSNERDAAIISTLDIQEPLYIVFSHKFSALSVRHIVLPTVFKSSNNNIILPEALVVDTKKLRKLTKSRLHLKGDFKPPMKRNIMSILDKLFIKLIPPSSTLHQENGDGYEGDADQLMKEWKSLHIHSVLPRVDLYENLISSTDEPLIYNIDVLAVGSKDSNARSMHHLVIQHIMNDLDRVDLNVGPIIGQVTNTTAKIMFEVNRNLRELVCEVRSKVDLLSAQAKALRLKQIAKQKQKEEEKEKQRMVAEAERPKSRAELRAERRGNLMSKARPQAQGEEEKDVAPEEKASLTIDTSTPMTSPMASPTAAATSTSDTPQATTDEPDPADEILAYEGPATITMSKIQSNKSIIFNFENLLPDTKYEIYLPALYGDRPLGKFTTMATSPLSVSFIATSGYGVPDHRAVDLLVDSVANQDSVNIPLLAREVKLMEVQRTSVLDDKDIWTWISYFLNKEGSRTTTVFHLGSHTIFPTFIKSMLQKLMAATRRFQLPISDCGGTGALYFNQLEEIVKDSFRAYYTIPNVKEALQSGSHMNIFHPDYILPIGPVSKDDELPSKILRKIFSGQIENYITNLQILKAPEPKRAQQYSCVWRNGNAVVVNLDVVTDRKRLKKEAADGAMSKTPKFSIGFLSGSQLALIASLLDDATITHLILMSKNTFIPLTEIPTEPLETTSLVDGDIIPWQPTVQDLTMFFDLLLRWQDPGRETVRFRKTAIVVCGSDIPFTTRIQETKTGIKCQQVGLGNLVKSASANGIPVTDIQRSGTFGGCRYFHRFQDLDSIIIDSSRENSSYNPSEHGNIPNIEGISLLRVWMDTWKSVGEFSYVSKSPLLSLEQRGAAVILAGPVVGTPISVPPTNSETQTSSSYTSSVYVPIMIEVDRGTILNVVIRNLFQGETTTMAYMVPSKEPYTFKIGPLDVENRYAVRFDSGLRQELELIVNTHISPNESNVIFLHCDRDDATPFSSEFMYDVAKRNKIPFSGITTNVHLNCRVDITNVITDLRFAEELDVAEVLEDDTISPSLRSIMEVCFETLQEEFRNFFSRPSYATVLKTGFHLLLPKRGDYEARMDAESKKGDDYDEEDEEKDNNELEKTSRPSSSKSPSRPSSQVGSRPTTAKSAKFSNGSSSRPGTGRLKRRRRKKSGMSRVEQMLWFIAHRLYQEYFMQLHDPDSNVFCYKVSNEGTGEDVIRTTSKSEMRVDAVYQIWRTEDAEPSSRTQQCFMLPNQRCTIEILPNMTPSNDETYTNIINDSKLEAGTRMLVVYPENRTIDNGDLFHDDDAAVQDFRKKCFQWIGLGDRADRSISIIVPTLRHGTMTLSSPETQSNVDAAELLQISLLDSTYKNNETSRLSKFAEAESEAKAAANAKKGGGASAAAHARKQKEAAAAAAKKKKEVDEFIASLGPDGYIISEGKTYTFVPPPPNDYTKVTVTYGAHRILSSLSEDIHEESLYVDPDAPRPSPLQYVQAPLWLQRFCPGNVDGVFFQDEVTLVMRQDAEIRPVLDIIEDDEMYLKISEIYQSSRLADLSRPAELREVDMEIIGVTEYFLSDTLKRIWVEAVPDTIKHLMVPLYDEFVKGYCLYRAMGADSDAVIVDGEAFTRAVQKSMIVSCSLMFCLKMKDMPKWKFIMDGSQPITSGGYESDLDDLDKDEERALEAELKREEEAAAEEERQRIREERREMGLPEEEEPQPDEKKSDGKKSDEGSRPGTQSSERPKTATVEEEGTKEAEIETFDAKELLEQTRDYFRNMQTERVLFRRRYGEKFIFKSPPM